MSSLTPEQRAQRARIAAYAMLAKHDPKETTKNARKAFLATFEDQVDPERQLDPPERQRRAEAARKEYFARLAFRSSVERSSRNGRNRAGGSR